MEGSSPSRAHGTRTEPLTLRSLPHRGEKGPVVPPTDPPTTPPRTVRGAAAQSEGQGSPESGSSSGGSRNTSPTKKYKQPYIQPRVGRMFQVSEWNLPDMHSADRRGAAVRSASKRPSIEKERPMMWRPGVVSDKLVEAFVEAVGKLEGCTMNGDAWDEGYKTLFRTRGNVQAALETVRALTEEREWTAEEKHIFLENIRYRDKEFAKIKEQLPNRTLGEVVEYFYRWKMSPEYAVWKAGRLPRQIEEQFVPDFHADNCHVCENPGELVCCDSCNLAYHWACLKRPGQIPREFVCPECREKYTDPRQLEEAKRRVDRECRRVEERRERERRELEKAVAEKGTTKALFARRTERIRGRKRLREADWEEEKPATAAGSDEASSSEGSAKLPASSAPPLSSSSSSSAMPSGLPLSALRSAVVTAASSQTDNSPLPAHVLLGPNKAMEGSAGEDSSGDDDIWQGPKLRSGRRVTLGSGSRPEAARTSSGGGGMAVYSSPPRVRVHEAAVGGGGPMALAGQGQTSGHHQAGEDLLSAPDDSDTDHDEMGKDGQQQQGGFMMQHAPARVGTVA